jgi:hypothetical protein
MRKNITVAQFKILGLSRHLPQGTEGSSNYEAEMLVTRLERSARFTTHSSLSFPCYIYLQPLFYQLLLFLSIFLPFIDSFFFSLMVKRMLVSCLENDIKVVLLKKPNSEKIHTTFQSKQ